MPNPDDPRAWIAKAGSDLLCINNNLHAPTVPWDAVAYHAQQAAEKMLKACLVHKGIEVPRSHDLGRLLGECLTAGIPLAHLAGDCDLLTPYGVAVRYPGDEPEVIESDARAAVEAAYRIVAATQSIVSMAPQ